MATRIPTKVSTPRLEGSALYRLDPFMDFNDIMRVGGRLRYASWSYELKHPVIIPKSSHITELIIRHCHEQVCHNGRTSTQNCIRQQGYWLINGSSRVRQYISQCVTCKRLRGALLTQRMAELPKDRFFEAPAFTYCAVDYFGPFFIKERRSQLKRYGVVFTCLSSRAIHLETANSLDTDSFINALRRFLARRGPVVQLRSDRGTNMVGAKNELLGKSININDEDVRRFLLRQQCEWVRFKFNPPHASHMGGVWERQIRSVRSSLELLLKEFGDQLDDETFRTLMAEVENIVNSRPLTYNTLNEAGAVEPLTPNHLLTMKMKPLLTPPGDFQRPDMYVRRRWRRVQYLANEFWSRWRKEYLQAIQLRSKWHSCHPNVAEGDIVLLADSDVPRNKWSMARILDVLPSNDGLVRKVRLAIAEQNRDEKGRRTSSPSVLERPIHKLVSIYRQFNDARNSDADIQTTEREDENEGARSPDEEPL